MVDRFNRGPGAVTDATRYRDRRGQPIPNPVQRLAFRSAARQRPGSTQLIDHAWSFQATYQVETMPISGANPEPPVDVGFIQSAVNYEFVARYDSGHESRFAVASARDPIEDAAPIPWHAAAGSATNMGPQPIGTAPPRIMDEPFAVFAVWHAEGDAISRVTARGEFRIWLIALRRGAPTSAIHFLRHITILWDREWQYSAAGSIPDRASPVAFVSSGNQRMRHGAGRGEHTPVLTGPTMNQRLAEPAARAPVPAQPPP